MQELVRADVEAYAEAHSIPESECCRALREETARTMAFPEMMVGPLEGAVLKMITHLTGASRVLELGMFTGYSALCFAEALPEDGRIITCEIDEAAAAVARRYFARSPWGRKIHVEMGPALETMRRLVDPFDLIFIDADKQNYPYYYRRAMELLAPCGAILIDNVLWDGDVLREPPVDERTAAIQDVNRIVASDPDAVAVLLTVRDGLFVVRRKNRADAEGRGSVRKRRE
jgi:caffeoyl-CoA O-methyltransferase